MCGCVRAPLYCHEGLLSLVIKIQLKVGNECIYECFCIKFCIFIKFVIICMCETFTYALFCGNLIRVVKMVSSFLLCLELTFVGPQVLLSQEVSSSNPGNNKKNKKKKQKRKNRRIEE